MLYILANEDVSIIIKTVRSKKKMWFGGGSTHVSVRVTDQWLVSCFKYCKVDEAQSRITKSPRL